MNIDHHMPILPDTKSIGNYKDQQFNDDQERLDAAKDFSKMFFGQMLRQLFKSTENSALWGDGHGAEMMKPIWIDAIADSCTGRTGFEKSIFKALGGKNYPSVDQKRGGTINVNA